MTAELSDGLVMAIDHKTLPFAAVQFHPESIMTDATIGLALINNALRCLKP